MNGVTNIRNAISRPWAKLRSLAFRRDGTDPVRDLPRRVTAIINHNEAQSERLIGWAQLMLAVTFAALYLSLIHISEPTRPY